MSNDIINEKPAVEHKVPASNDPVRSGDFVASLSLVRKRCESWNLNERKASDHVLYGLLADCMALYERVKKSRTLYEKLSAYLVEREIKVGANSSGLGKVVKAVFGTNEPYVNAYIGVLGIALKLNIGAGEIKDWLIEEEGINKVRRTHSKPKAASNTRDDEVKRGREKMLKQRSYCAISGAAPMLPTDKENNTGFVIALLRKDGADLSVVHVLPRLSTVEAMLRRIGAEATGPDNTSTATASPADPANGDADAALVAELNRLAA